MGLSAGRKFSQIKGDAAKEDTLPRVNQGCRLAENSAKYLHHTGGRRSISSLAGSISSLARSISSLAGSISSLGREY